VPTIDRASVHMLRQILKRLHRGVSRFWLAQPEHQTRGLHDRQQLVLPIAHTTTMGKRLVHCQAGTLPVALVLSDDPAAKGNDGLRFDRRVIDVRQQSK